MGADETIRSLQVFRAVEQIRLREHPTHVESPYIGIHTCRWHVLVRGGDGTIRRCQSLFMLLTC